MMSHTQFREALARLELSQLGAARLFGSDGRTVRRWALGERSIPTGIQLMLGLMLTGKISADDIESVRERYFNT